MILSKDSNTLNLTASILSAKSMLQTKLDEIGIDIKVIERNLDTLKTEVTKLKKEVEETKEELVTAAEELKTKTDNEAIKQKIDEVSTKLDGVEIDEDFLDGLCLTTCNMMDGSCDCFGTGFSNKPTGCTDCYDYCYDYSEPEEVCIGYDQPVCDTCYGGCFNFNFDQLSSCPENKFSYNQPVCTDKYNTCQVDYCHLGFFIGNTTVCIDGFHTQECIELGDSRIDSLEAEGHTSCGMHYKNDDLDCEDLFEYNGGYHCETRFSTDKQECEHIYSTGLNDEGKIDSIECSASFNALGKDCHIGYTYDDLNDTCEQAFKDDKNQCAVNYIESNGVVSCETSHSGNDGTCSKDHTWSDGIGGQCKEVFNNSQMNCQGGVATNEAEQQLLCDGDYTSGNINCVGGYAEDTDDHETFCPSNFSDGHTTCRHMYMKQNGVETCSNKDPISCRGGCVSGYCDYCGGCVGSCDSCRSCHGSGNCSYTVCKECHGTKVTYNCGKQACGSYHDYCVAHSYGIVCTGDY